jgi:hypothetical protein
MKFKPGDSVLREFKVVSVHEDVDGAPMYRLEGYESCFREDTLIPYDVVLCPGCGKMHDSGYFSCSCDWDNDYPAPPVRTLRDIIEGQG